MLNIFRIFISDFKRLKTNVVAVVMVIGLSILPCLYAWFNILSNWSPYGPDATSNIKVAVASDDKGITIDDTEFNMGETVIEGLEANTTIGWVFTDTTEEAVDGVYSGDYYAALIMPEDFTEDMVSFLADEMEHPEITYYTNEKKNAIAPKITDKAKTAVQQTVNTQFISTLIKSCMQVSDGLIDSSVLEEETGSSNVIDMLIGKLEEADADLAVYENLLDSLKASHRIFLCFPPEYGSVCGTEPQAQDQRSGRLPYKTVKLQDLSNNHPGTFRLLPLSLHPLHT